jgi:Type II secretion system (T2SS), protein E, N-terminal domain
MKLGEMLVRDGRILPVQLQHAIAHQARSGGRLGSILVELGYLDAETLTVYLGLGLGMPIATGATLERCKRSAVRLLTPQQAARYRCVPIVIQGQTLILAIADPLDMPTLDALHNVTGYRVLPRVAPEIRIYYYLERFYGVPRPHRFVALGDSPRGNPAIGSHTGGLPGPPLPGLPPRRSAPMSVTGPQPTVRRAASVAAERNITRPPPVPAPLEAAPMAPATMPMAAAPMPASTPMAAAPMAAAPMAAANAPVRALTAEEHEALEIDANDLVDELDADDAATAGRVPAHAARASARLPAAAPRAPISSAALPALAHESIAADDRDTERGPHPVLTLDTALAVMASTDQRGAVADAILGYAASMFEVAALCLVRDHLAVGWKGFGPAVDDERIETLLVPLEMPSIYQLAERSRELFRGHAFPAALHDHVFKVLRCPPPLYSVVAPILIGQRVVNLLYAHKPGGVDLLEEEIVGVRQLVAAAGEAYVRLISASKAQRKSA